MAAKKIPSLEDALKSFKNVMERAFLNEYIYMNKTLISKSNGKKEFYVLIIPEQELWNKIVEDPELDVKELDVNNPEQQLLLQKISYADSLDDIGWVEIDIDKFYKGDIINIRPEGFEYNIPINKSLLPLKLRKAEYNNLSYRIFKGNNNTSIIALKKKFESKVEGCNYTLIRLFQIV